jgi:hypothetical protein
MQAQSDAASYEALATDEAGADVARRSRRQRRLSAMFAGRIAQRRFAAARCPRSVAF